MLPTPCCRGDGAETPCPRCGRPAASAEVAEPMLRTLTQLAQFGLDAEAPPLLESRDKES